MLSFITQFLFLVFILLTGITGVMIVLKDLRLSYRKEAELKKRRLAEGRYENMINGRWTDEV